MRPEQRMKHIDFAQLVDSFEGKLTALEMARVDEHVTHCGECYSAHGKLAAIFSYTAPVETESVPQATTARILNIYQRKPVPQESPVPTLRGLASLIFDDWQMAVNERYSGIDSRQLLYKTGEYDIDLRIDLAGEKVVLGGQIFPELIGATAELTSSEQNLTAIVNEFGEFAFAPMDTGTYDLLITAGDIVITIEQVPLER